MATVFIGQHWPTATGLLNIWIPTECQDLEKQCEQHGARTPSLLTPVVPLVLALEAFTGAAKIVEVKKGCCPKDSQGDCQQQEIGPSEILSDFKQKAFLSKNAVDSEEKFKRR